MMNVMRVEFSVLFNNSSKLIITGYCQWSNRIFGKTRGTIWYLCRVKHWSQWQQDKICGKQQSLSINNNDLSVFYIFLVFSQSSGSKVSQQKQNNKMPNTSNLNNISFIHLIPRHNNMFLSPAPIIHIKWS